MPAAQPPDLSLLCVPDFTKNSPACINTRSGYCCSDSERELPAERLACLAGGRECRGLGRSPPLCFFDGPGLMSGRKMAKKAHSKVRSCILETEGLHTFWPVRIFSITSLKIVIIKA